MIQFDGVSLAFAGHFLFKNASFTLQKGEKCGLVGRNGSGKSTMFGLIVGQNEPDEGSISMPKDYRIGHLEQHISFSESTILEEAALGLPHHEQDHIYKAEKILFGLGFTQEDMYADPSSFSGGYQLRLHLAKVLISSPDCLLLDEPTNYLDILSIRWLLQFLKKWRGELIIISHDRDFMDQVTTHTMGIHRENVKKIKGSSLDFFEQIILEEEIHEKTRVKLEKKRSHMQDFVDRFGAKATKATQAQSRVKLLAREPVLEKLNQLHALSFSFRERAFPGKNMLEAKNLHFSYTGEPLIEDISLEIEKGERIAIIGKNGRGKSTLLNLLGGSLNPSQGTVDFSINTKIGHFGQTHIQRLNKQHTIAEEIGLANPALSYTEVKGIAGVMMFSGLDSDKKISVLSGGERSRVLIGKIVAKPCNLLLLDEPTHHLDIESIEALIDALEDFAGSIVMVTHSELILRRLQPHKIIVCEEAKQSLFLGNYDEFLENCGWDEEKGTSTKKQKPRKNKESPLKPIERDIKKQEEKLILLEEEIRKNQTRLDEGDTSIELMKTLGEQDKKKQELEAKLYSLYEELEAKKQQFQ